MRLIAAGVVREWEPKLEDVIWERTSSAWRWLEGLTEWRCTRNLYTRPTTGSYRRFAHILQHNRQANRHHDPSGPKHPRSRGVHCQPSATTIFRLRRYTRWTQESVGPLSARAACSNDMKWDRPCLVASLATQVAISRRVDRYKHPLRGRAKRWKAREQKADLERIDANDLVLTHALPYRRFVRCCSLALRFLIPS